MVLIQLSFTERDFAAFTGMLELEFNENYMLSEISLCKCMD